MAEKTRVLVVDDDETTLEVTSLLLEQRGYEVLTRSSALGTTAMIVREQPDLVLLDVNMPGLNGDKIVKLLGGKEDARGIGFILYSGVEANELEPMAQRCGAIGWIRKSSDLGSILNQFDSIASGFLSARRSSAARIA